MGGQDFHRLYPDEFEEAEAEAAGAIVGWLAGKGEPGPQWTAVFRDAFRCATAVAFDAGVRVGQQADL